jgi:CelD/BcsL family acetyltransferase involved in cellulose biosynthesis
MTIDIDVHRDSDAFGIPGWRDLLARDPNTHIFATPEWHHVWWEEFGAGKELLVLAMRRGGQVFAIVPLYRKLEGDRRILRFVGGIDLTDYLGPICSIEDRHDAAAALVAWLLETDREWDEFDAHNMPVPFGFAESLVERADHHGLRFALDQEETSAVLKLPDSWDEYLAALGSKDRHELKRKRRRLQREHPDMNVRRSTEATLEDDLAAFVAMHRGTEGHKGHFMRPEIATFFERMSRSFLPLGWLRLDFLEIGGRPVASTFSFELGDTFYLYNSAYEPDFGRLSPGLILVAALIEDAIEKGLKTFDLLRGPERYKYQLGSEAMPLNNVQLFRATS